MAKILYVNHGRQQCGVYEFGKAIANVLLESGVHNFRYCECDSYEELHKVYQLFKPEVIIYNYHPGTMPWIHAQSRYDVPVTYKLKAIHIGTIHEVYQDLADEITDEIFDFHVGPDPTLTLNNPIVFKTGRLLPYKPEKGDASSTSIPVIGSFGFATGGKGFDKIIRLVQQEFDEAVIRFNIPFARFGDENGANARRTAEECRRLVNKNSIKLEIDHTYLEKQDLLAFLKSNSINIFLYDDLPQRGISSATDWALACGKPLAISKSRLFRHLFHCQPSVCVEDNSLRAILMNGTSPVEHIWDAWSSKNMLSEYERIVKDSIQKPSKSRSGKRNRIFFYSKKALKKAGFAG